jgi:hypothetical protein
MAAERERLSIVQGLNSKDALQDLLQLMEYNRPTPKLMWRQCINYLSTPEFLASNSKHPWLPTYQ